MTNAEKALVTGFADGLDGLGAALAALAEAGMPMV